MPLTITDFIEQVDGVTIDNIPESVERRVNQQLQDQTGKSGGPDLANEQAILVSKSLGDRAGFNTIQDAIDGNNPQNGAEGGASSGDTIFIEEGTFTEEVSVPTQDVTLVGRGAGETIIQGQIDATGSGFGLRGTTVQAEPGVTDDTALLVDDGANLTVTDNTIVARQGGFAVRVKQPPQSGGESAIIQNNTIQSLGNETAQSLVVIGSNGGGSNSSLDPVILTDGGVRSDLDQQPIQNQATPSSAAVQIIQCQFVGNVSGLGVVQFEVDVSIDADVENNDFSETVLFDQSADPVTDEASSVNVEITLDQNEDPAPLSESGGISVPGSDVLRVADTSDNAPLPGLEVSQVAASLVSSNLNDSDGFEPKPTESIDLLLENIRDSAEKRKNIYQDFESLFSQEDNITKIKNNSIDPINGLLEATGITDRYDGSPPPAQVAVDIAPLPDPVDALGTAIDVLNSQTLGGANAILDCGAYTDLLDQCLKDNPDSSASDVRELNSTLADKASEVVTAATVDGTTITDDQIKDVKQALQAERGETAPLSVLADFTEISEGPYDKLPRFVDASVPYIKNISRANASAIVGIRQSLNESVDQLQSIEAGQGINNPVHAGDERALGVFNNAGGPLNIGNGIILGTGKVTDVQGPNSSPSTATSFGTPGDPDLEDLPTITNETFDASTLSFDLDVPSGVSDISFRYVFGSEEYNEFTASSFNDVFAFFVNGENVATVPDPDNPNNRIAASINNVNHGQGGTNATNPQLFINNDPYDGDAVTVTPQNPPGPGIGFDPSTGDEPFNTEMDGFTTTLKVTAPVNPGTTNTVKIAIADVSDRVFSSWVLIPANSFVVETGPTL